MILCMLGSLCSRVRARREPAADWDRTNQTVVEVSVVSSLRKRYFPEELTLTAPMMSTVLRSDIEDVVVEGEEREREERSEGRPKGGVEERGQIWPEIER